MYDADKKETVYRVVIFFFLISNQLCVDLLSKEKLYYVDKKKLVEI